MNDNKYLYFLGYLKHPHEVYIMKMNINRFLALTESEELKNGWGDVIEISEKAFILLTKNIKDKALAIDLINFDGKNFKYVFL